jgi:hypothetical protein
VRGATPPYAVLVLHRAVQASTPSPLLKACFWKSQVGGVEGRRIRSSRPRLKKENWGARVQGGAQLVDFVGSLTGAGRQISLPHLLEW